MLNFKLIKRRTKDIVRPLKGGMSQMMKLQRRHRRLGSRRQDAVDGEERRRRSVDQRGRSARAAQQQRRAEQRGRVPRPAARPAHALAPSLAARAFRHAASPCRPRLAPLRTRYPLVNTAPHHTPFALLATILRSR